MDNNEFSIDRLLCCNEFSRYESSDTLYAMNSFLKTVRECVSDEEDIEKIKRENADLVYFTFDDAFKQGFSFAMKTVNFLMKY